MNREVEVIARKDDHRSLPNQDQPCLLKDAQKVPGILNLPVLATPPTLDAKALAGRVRPLHRAAAGQLALQSGFTIAVRCFSSLCTQTCKAA